MTDTLDPSRLKQSSHLLGQPRQGHHACQLLALTHPSRPVTHWVLLHPQSPNTPPPSLLPSIHSHSRHQCSELGQHPISPRPTQLPGWSSYNGIRCLETNTVSPRRTPPPHGSSLVAQWSGPGAFTAVAPGSIPGQETKIPQATRQGQNKTKKHSPPPSTFLRVGTLEAYGCYFSNPISPFFVPPAPLTLVTCRCRLTPRPKHCTPLRLCAVAPVVSPSWASFPCSVPAGIYSCSKSRLNVTLHDGFPQSFCLLPSSAALALSPGMVPITLH